MSTKTLSLISMLLCFYIAALPFDPEILIITLAILVNKQELIFIAFLIEYFHAFYILLIFYIPLPPIPFGLFIYPAISSLFGTEFNYWLSNKLAAYVLKIIGPLWPE